MLLCVNEKGEVCDFGEWPIPNTALTSRYFPRSRRLSALAQRAENTAGSLGNHGHEAPVEAAPEEHPGVGPGQIVANLERTVLETEKKVERIISRGPTPRNLKTNYQKNVPDANGRRIEDIRKTLRGARRSSTCCCASNVA